MGGAYLNRRADAPALSLSAFGISLQRGETDGFLASPGMTGAPSLPLRSISLSGGGGLRGSRLRRNDGPCPLPSPPPKTGEGV